MASQNSTQYAAAYVTEPKSKLDPKERDGKLRRIFAECTLTSELAIGETISFAKLPANATIIDCNLSVSASFGTASEFDLGWGAGDEALEAADPNGLIDAFDATATTLGSMIKTQAGSLAGYNKKFTESVDIEAESQVLTIGATGKTIRLEVTYIIE